MRAMRIDHEGLAYEDIMRAIEVKCQERSTETMHDFRFWSRSADQRRGETFDGFLERIRSAASQCNFGATEDRLIRSRIIIGMGIQELQKRLLSEDHTLEQAHRKCRSAETGEISARALRTPGHPAEIIATVNNNNNTASAEAGAVYNDEDVREVSTLRRRQCQARHPQGYCPARGELCNDCGVCGHFARECPVKRADDANRRGGRCGKPNR